MESGIRLGCSLRQDLRIPFISEVRADTVALQIHPEAKLATDDVLNLFS